MIPIYEADRLEDLPLFDRSPQAEEDVGAAVDAILADVRTRGDEALREYTRRFNGVALTSFEVAKAEMEAAWEAADLLSQAEHDAHAAAVLVTDSRPLAEAVQNEVERQLTDLPRRDIAQKSLEANGKILVTKDLAAAMEAANRIAPEHLELCVDDPFALLPLVKNAGSVFLGRHTPEALGDYFAGPNHTLPTSGTARFSSPLSVDDFVKKTQFIYYTREALADAAPRIADFAEREGLHGHARSALSRTEEKGE